MNLFVLGHSNRPGGFKTWALGTVPMYAVQHGNCPVLVVNHPEGPQAEYHAVGEEKVATEGAEVAQGASFDPTVVESAMGTSIATTTTV